MTVRRSGNDYGDNFSAFLVMTALIVFAKCIYKNCHLTDDVQSLYVNVCGCVICVYVCVCVFVYIMYGCVYRPRCKPNMNMTK